MRIDDRQIEYILDDLSRNGIVTEELQYNLLDHICCLLEEKLSPDDDFKSVYHSEIKKFYSRNLREIEDETVNLLTFKNFYTMKKMMIYSGVLCAVLFVLGALFKFMFWPGTSLLFLGGVFFFSFVFLPLLFILKVKEVNSGLEKLVVALGALLGSMFCINILFTVQHWPAANELWKVSIAFTLFIFIPLFFFSGYRKPETRVNTILTTFMLVGFACLAFMFAVRHTPYIVPPEPLNRYVQNERILNKIRASAQDGAYIKEEAKDVWKTLQQIREQITGSNNNLLSDETTLAEMAYHRFPEAYPLIYILKQQIDTYNSREENTDSRIPVENTIMALPEELLYSTTVMTVLTDITHLQVFLLVH